MTTHLEGESLVFFQLREIMSIDVLLMDFAVSRRDSTIPIEFTNALRRFSPPIDDFLMEVAVSRCGSTIPIEFTTAVRRFPPVFRHGSTSF